MTPFFALVRMELRLFFADPRAVIMSVIAPIAIASFFGYIFGGGAGNTERSKIPVLIADLDGSNLTQEVVRRLKADASLDVKPATPEQCREAVRKGKATAAFVIPKDFAFGTAAAFLAGGSRPEIAMLQDPSQELEMRMLQGIVTGAVMGAAGKQLSGGREEIPLPFGVRAESVTSDPTISYNGYAHSFGGMGIQFLLMVGVEVGVGLLLRRQLGVWKRLRAAPISRMMLLGSRIVSGGITSMATLMILFAFARVVFGVHIQGSLAGFLGICASFSLMTAALGLVISTLGKTAEATRAVAIVATLLMVMLGGAWVPTFIFPRWLQNITVVMPTRWAMDGLDAVTWRGLGFSTVAPQIGLLLGCAVVFGAFAVWRFRWEEN